MSGRRWRMSFARSCQGLFWRRPRVSTSNMLLYRSFAASCACLNKKGAADWRTSTPPLLLTAELVLLLVTQSVLQREKLCVETSGCVFLLWYALITSKKAGALSCVVSAPVSPCLHSSPGVWVGALPENVGFWRWCPEMNEDVWFWTRKFLSRFAAIDAGNTFTFPAFLGVYSLDKNADSTCSLVPVQPSGLPALAWFLCQRRVAL